ncbi:uncharacterized protein LOC132295141 [Cornus florida]|uniref:uncharacterized protein LOC132295141 n=1 Tax=Cornus florida TaxID=4283 RepID=UPI00289FD576|nr:uncharacterized protein LOC132295141 [Cornus florida]XP_059649247.1 uncharacterized protein LOC132295141 [Cornus florida]XP_059649248.1 uncharacterized protein LOC132295141 [Cornus florida]
MDWLSTQRSKIDALILEGIADMRQLKNELAQASAHDYRSIMLPVLSTFGQAIMEDLVARDAFEKAKAGGEALLAELTTLDTEKNNKGGNPTKHTQEKVREQAILKQWKELEHIIKVEAELKDAFEYLSQQKQLAENINGSGNITAKEQRPQQLAL